VDIAKLREYCLNPAYPRGRHKARVFASILGLTPTDAEFLPAEVLRAVREGSATPGTATNTESDMPSISNSSAAVGRQQFVAPGSFAGSIRVPA
jgi:hypothetical protein